jgi:hypothetical protein
MSYYYTTQDGLLTVKESLMFKTMFDKKRTELGPAKFDESVKEGERRRIELRIERKNDPNAWGYDKDADPKITAENDEYERRKIKAENDRYNAERKSHTHGRAPTSRSRPESVTSRDDEMEQFYNWISMSLTPALSERGIFGIGTFSRLVAYLGLNPDTGETLNIEFKSILDKCTEQSIQIVGEWIATKLSSPIGPNQPALHARQVTHPKYEDFHHVSLDEFLHAISAAHPSIHEQLNQLYDNTYLKSK